MKTSMKTLIASAVVLTLAGVAGAAHAEMKPGMEKCYGIAKAGKNDCAAKEHNCKGQTCKGHSCAGQSQADGGVSEWIAVPAGTCDKLVNGSTKAPMMEEHAK